MARRTIEVVVTGDSSQFEAAMTRIANSAQKMAVGHAAATKEMTAAERAAGVLENHLGGLAQAGTDVTTALGTTTATLSALGVAAGAGLLIEAGKQAIAVADARSNAEANLSQALQATGANQEYVSKELDDFLAKNRSFISSQSDVVQGWAALTRSGLDADKVQRDMNIALDLSAVKNISLSDAVDLVSKAEQGRTIGLIDLGFNTKAITAANQEADKSLNAVTETEKQAQAAHQNLAQAQRRLVELQDELSVKRKTTKVDLDHLQDAQNAVAKATQDATAADQAAAVAKANAKDKIDLVNTAMDELADKTRNGRDAMTDSTRATNRLNNDWQDLATKAGPSLQGMLTQLVDWTDQLYTAMDNLGKNQGFWDNLNNGAIDFLGTLKNVLDTLTTITSLGTNKLGSGDYPAYPAGAVPAGGYVRGGRATGGPVQGGSPYMVGENGPEVFVPNGSGSIVPSPGGHTFNITVNGGSDPNAIASAVRTAIRRELAMRGL